MQQTARGRGQQPTKKRLVKHPLHNGVTKRLQFQFPEAAIHALRDLAVRTGQPTVAGVLREALKVYTWIVNEQEQGRAIFSADQRTRRRREILLLLQMPSRSAERDRAGTSVIPAVTKTPSKLEGETINKSPRRRIPNESRARP